MVQHVTHDIPFDRSHPIAVVAIGGNSLISDKEHQTVPHQWDAVQETARQLVNMVSEGWTVVVTHGNGPQVGFIMRRNELAAAELHTTPMDLIVADTQGAMGYMLQQSMNNEFLRRGLYRRAFTIVTQVEVDPADPAFQNPSKPVGSFLDAATAELRRAEGWHLVQDAGRGWRRVVPSPEPMDIVEQDAIIDAVKTGWIVVAGGGGGIPVVRDEAGRYQGIAAVIDKDRVSALLATRLHADLLVISTAVERVSLHYGRPEEVDLDRVSLEEARAYLAQGHFPPGSMGPKIEAALAFVEQGGRQAIITDPPNLGRALRGETGTRILPG
ncbi:MAG: carbamate kinase [bacterium]